MQPMVERLVAIQAQEGWSDGRMAQEISISRPSWNLIRRGKRLLPASIAIQVAGRFPELTRELLDLVPSAPERRKEQIA